MIYNLAIIDVMQAIEHALRGLLGQLCILVYNLIATFYDLFLKLSKINILQGNDIVEKLYNRVGLILGIFMVFKLVFSLVQSLVDPNKLTDKKNGVTSIIMRSVISIVLLGLTPALFNEAYDLQATLVGAKSTSDNILYKLIFADTSKTSDDFGKELAVNFYFSFFKDENYPYLSNEIDNQNSLSAYSGNTLETISNNIVDSGSFSDTYPYLMMTVNDTFVIEFSPFLCLGAGILVLWMLITYSFQIAVRVFQLAYLQLIAPIPILSYISKPDGSFKTWLKQCSTTFLDLFLRLAIIYFVMYMVNALQGIFNNIGNSANSGGGSVLLEIFLICGLLIFAKKVPDLLKELFPSSGGAASLGLGLKAPKEVTSFGKGAATLGIGAAVGGVAGLATGIKQGEGIKGKLAGAATGLGRGVFSAKTKGNVIGNAKKGVASQRMAAQRAYERNHDGSSWWGRNFGASGAQRTKEAFDKELAAYDSYNSYASIIDKELEKNEHVQHAMAYKDNLLKNGGTADDIKAAQDAIKAAKQSALDRELRDGKNATLMTALDNAEAIRAKGVSLGYEGFSSTSITSGSAEDRFKAIKESKDKAAEATSSIKDPAGTRNKEYKLAEANAKYNKTK